VVAAMLCQLLRQRGMDADLVHDGETDGFDKILISALPPFAIMHARSLCRKLRKRYPGVRVVLGVWKSVLPAGDIKQRLGSDCADAVVTSLDGALNELYPDDVPMIAEHAAAVN
jgi:DNA-binding transcriptional LysR family regulator